jgi:erythromycin esterase
MTGSVEDVFRRCGVQRRIVSGHDAGDQSGLASRPFVVPPAPAGSLDATLAATRLPLFALSLHDAPAWFGEPHESREIGATYPEGQPYGSMMRFAPRDAFDALLFVERTNAAKQNPR